MQLWLCDDGLQAGRSSLLQRRIELDAEVLCRYDRSRRNHSLLSQRKLVSDADVVVATPAAGGPFFFAAAKIRIGRGMSLLPRHLQAGRSFLLLRKLESDAEGRCRDGRSRRAILLCSFESLHPRWFDSGG